MEFKIDDSVHVKLCMNATCPDGLDSQKPIVIKKQVDRVFDMFELCVTCQGPLDELVRVVRTPRTREAVDRQRVVEEERVVENKGEGSARYEGRGNRIEGASERDHSVDRKALDYHVTSLIQEDQTVEQGVRDDRVNVSSKRGRSSGSEGFGDFVDGTSKRRKAVSRVTYPISSPELQYTDANSTQDHQSSASRMTSLPSEEGEVTDQKPDTNPGSVEVSQPPTRPMHPKREFKWCLNCHENDHSVDQCGPTRSRQSPIFLDLGWGMLRRALKEEWLQRRPRNILQLMDQLELFFHPLCSNLETFQLRRDNLFKAKIADAGLMELLKGHLGSEKVIPAIYKSQIAAANNATRAFLIHINDNVTSIFNAIVDTQLKQNFETVSEVRRRMAPRILRDGRDQKVTMEFLKEFQSDIESSWTKYAEKMDALERGFIGTHFQGRWSNQALQKELCYPTSGVRLIRCEFVESGPSWIPYFRYPTLD